MTSEKSMGLWKPAAFHPFLKQRLKLWDCSAEDNSGPFALRGRFRGGGCPLPGPGRRCHPVATTGTAPICPARALPWQVLGANPPGLAGHLRPEGCSVHTWAHESAKHSPVPSDKDLSGTDGQFAPQLSLMTSKIKTVRRKAQRKTHIPVPVFKPSCTPSMEKSDGCTSMVSMKGQVWVSRVHLCTDRHCVWNSLNCWPTHIAPAWQLDPTDATCRCDRQLHAPSRG